jgi:hypothetical protein
MEECFGSCDLIVGSLVWVRALTLVLGDRFVFFQLLTNKKSTWPKNVYF